MSNKERFARYVMQKLRNKEKKPFQIFLSGTAGTGKTLFILSLIDLLISEGMKKHLNFYVCASTNQSANAIKGRAVHSRFGFPRELVEGKIYNEAYCPRLRLLIVDEITILSKMVVDALDVNLRSMKREADTIFGGCNILFVGDLLQLTAGKEQLLTGAKSWSSFNYFEFKTISRQAEDHGLAERLSRWRVGQVVEDDVPFLKSRVVCGNGWNLAKIVESFLCLRTRNFYILTLRRVAAYMYNDAIVTKRFGDLAIKVFVKLIKSDSTSIDEPMQLRTGVHKKDYEHFFIATGSRVMLDENYYYYEGDQRKKLCNGETGSVISWETELDHVKSIKIKFDDHPGGIVVERTCGTELDFFGNEWTTMTFPLLTAYALTYHKAQGKTLDRVLLDTSNWLMPAMFFTGASRIKKTEDLFLTEVPCHNAQHLKELLIHQCPLAKEQIKTHYPRNSIKPTHTKKYNFFIFYVMKILSPLTKKI